MTIPEVGVLFEYGPELMIPSYVALSEAPRPNGACQTDGEIIPAGWYIEFRYPDHTDHHRRFIPFPS